MNKKVLKREALLDELKDGHAKELKKVHKELMILQQQNKEMEFELLSHKKVLHHT